MKTIQKVFWATLFGSCVLSTNAFADMAPAPMKSIKCGSQTYAIVTSENGKDYAVYAISKPTTNSNGMNMRTKAVQNAIPNGYDMKNAKLSCSSNSLNISVLGTNFGKYGSTSSNYLKLLLTSSGRVYDVSPPPVEKLPTYPFGRYPYQIQ